MGVYFGPYLRFGHRMCPPLLLLRSDVISLVAISVCSFFTAEGRGYLHCHVTRNSNSVLHIQVCAQRDQRLCQLCHFVVLHTALCHLDIRCAGSLFPVRYRPCALFSLPSVVGALCPRCTGGACGGRPGCARGSCSGSSPPQAPMAAAGEGCLGYLF